MWGEMKEGKSAKIEVEGGPTVFVCYGGSGSFDAGIFFRRERESVCVMGIVT